MSSSVSMGREVPHWSVFPWPALLPGLCPYRPAAALSAGTPGGAAGGSSPLKRRKPWTGRRPVGLESGSGGEQAAVGGLRPAPPHLFFPRRPLVQGLVLSVPLAWRAGLRRKWLRSGVFFLPGPLCTTVPLAPPHPLWPSACDSPILPRRCCPVGKSSVPLGSKVC